MDKQQPTERFNQETADIVQNVYLKSYEHLRKSGKEANESFETAKRISAATGLVIQSDIALYAIHLFLQEAGGYHNPNYSNKQDSDVESDEHSSGSVRSEESAIPNDAHVIPMK